MNELQCPHCGGYKVSVVTRYTRSEPAELKQKIAFTLFFQIPVVCVAVVYGGPSPLLLIIDALIVAWVWLLAKRQVATGFKFSCNLCGYQWEWMIGTPLPEVTVRPELITAGSIRLAQEEEYQRMHGEIKCEGCGNTVPAGYGYCPYCGRSR